MSLDTLTDTNSTTASDNFDDVELFYIEDDHPRAITPLPTFDSSEYITENFINPIESEMSVLMNTPPPDLLERPETSNSSIFSFDTETVRTPPPLEALRLPEFVVPEDSVFTESSSIAEVKRYARFYDWLSECKPQGNFASVSAEELAKHPRELRTVPEVPSLFKRREHGCGYCRSNSYPRWETHTRQKCEQLRALAPCKVCRAHGEMNHTETYCPMKPPVTLRLKRKFVLTSERGDFQRSRDHFYKHNSLIQSLYLSSD